MEQFVTITRGNVQEYIQRYQVLVCSLRHSRSRSKHLALWELYFVLRPWDSLLITNGPLGEVGGQVAFFVDPQHLPAIRQRLESIGYTDNYYLLEFYPQHSGHSEFSWKGAPFRVEPFYQQDKELYDAQSPHRRTFYIYDTSGRVQAVEGYRGDGSDTGRRGLPVEDARLLVNLAYTETTQVLLDPFAGGGGILVAAKHIDPKIQRFSGDIDSTVAPGLAHYAHRHITVDASLFPSDIPPVDALVTEVPFFSTATASVARALPRLGALLSPLGRLSLMCGLRQHQTLKKVLRKIPMHPLVEEPVERQGMDVMISLWLADWQEYQRYQELQQAISIIY